MINLNDFVCKYITGRSESLISEDIKNHFTDLQESIEGKSVLVIGGAGSIGSSFIKALLHFQPRKLVVVDINENGLAELTRELRSSKKWNLPQEYTTYPIDYSSVIFEKMFRKSRGFQIVANFSAHKHVRSEKDIYSIEALLRNNVLNTKKFLELLAEMPPDVYFCVSTDKAANPANIMGASKRIMEDMIFSYSDKFPVKTARFANVAFSNGSLLEGFLKRMEKKQPISAPSDIKRYFVSLEESGQLCLVACMLGNNREIVYPKLASEQMISFDAIAENLIRESGFDLLYCKSEKEAIDSTEKIEKFNQYPVYFSVSDTSGEKKYEEFYTEDEWIDEMRYLRLGVIGNKKAPEKARIDELCQMLEKAFLKSDLSKEEVVALLKKYLTNFEHIETGKSLEQKM
ncbi:MAG: polysaccharide biosynthesis protein [Lachnospiraceae bacterium]|jgi:FlaA1/EpsC-like NDP-sugar epimerase|nr:polysaccharide biosynthesis protein [Lachnospiraceae bacterium]